MRKLTLVGAALMVAALLPAGLSVHASAATAAPQLSCTVKSVAIQGKKLVAVGSCKYGTTVVPAKNVKWTWSYHSADLDGGACGSFGFASGTSTQAPLPAPHTGESSAPNPAMPGILKATFTVTASYKGHVAKASKVFSKTTPTTRVQCGPPPKLVTVSLATGAQPSAVWGAKPTYSGGTLHAGTQINVAGLGQCKWHSGQPYMQNGYLVVPYRFTCDNGAQGVIGMAVVYAQQAGSSPSCLRTTNGAKTYIVPAWGPGFLQGSVYVSLWDSSGKYLGHPGAATWTSGWLPLKGTTPICSG
jgi:hypothetical protein